MLFDIPQDLIIPTVVFFILILLTDSFTMETLPTDPRNTLKLISKAQTLLSLAIISPFTITPNPHNLTPIPTKTRGETKPTFPTNTIRTLRILNPMANKTVHTYSKLRVLVFVPLLQISIPFDFCMENGGSSLTEIYIFIL